MIEQIAGETWAVVYAYESPRRLRGLWYDRWRYDVINDYVSAVSLLGAEPFVIDVDGFLVSDRLKSGEFDFVVNLNSGATPVSNLGLVPSTAEWHGLPSFPNSADVILTGERKDLCKRVFSEWFNVPREVEPSLASLDPQSCISKPLTMGNSQGVSRGVHAPQGHDSVIVEQFIRGFDVTVPVFFEHRTSDFVTCPGVAYLPDVSDPDGWFLSYEQKMDRSIVIERRLCPLAPDLTEALIRASRAFRFQSIARFDFRWATALPLPEVISREDLWFLEINCLPTLRTDVNFLKSLKAHLAKDDDASAALPDCGNDDVRALAFLLAQARAGGLRTR